MPDLDPSPDNHRQVVPPSPPASPARRTLGATISVIWQGALAGLETELPPMLSHLLIFGFLLVCSLIFGGLVFVIKKAQGLPPHLVFWPEDIKDYTDFVDLLDIWVTAIYTCIYGVAGVCHLVKKVLLPIFSKGDE